MQKAFSLIEIIVVVILIGMVSVSLLSTDFLSLQESSSQELEASFRDLKYNLQLQKLSTVDPASNQMFAMSFAQGISTAIIEANEMGDFPLAEAANQCQPNANRAESERAGALLEREGARSYFCDTSWQAAPAQNEEEALVFFQKLGDQNTCFLRENRQDLKFKRIDLGDYYVYINALVCKLDLIPKP